MASIFLPYAGSVIKLNDETCWQALRPTPSAPITPVTVIGKYANCENCLSVSSAISSAHLLSSSLLFPTECCETGDWNSGDPEEGNCENCGQQIKNSYRIKNYTDGDIPASDENCTCDECDPEGVVWDGTFSVPISTNECMWEDDDTATCLDGTNFYYASIVLDLVNSVWVLSILSTEFCLVWEGKKYYGCTPVGTYDKTGGCAPTPSSLEIEESP